PTFDPEGNYLFFLTDRELSPVYGGLDATWIYPNNTRLAAAALRADVPSPLAPRNDTEPVKEEKPDQKEKATNGNDKPAEAEEAAAGEAGETAAEETAAPPDPKEAVAKKDEAAGKEKQTLAIELDGLEKRVVLLPPDRGNYTDLRALKGQVLYRKLPFAGSADRTTPIMAYDLKERKEMPILDDADGFVIAAGGKKMLVAQRRAFYIVDIRPKQKLTDRLNTGDMAMMMDPRAEWRQIYTDVWRRYRDMFYDPTLHGLDWAAMRDRYGALLDDAVTRWDINHIIGNLIAEISSSHTYVGGGDVESPARESVGLLGIDWALENGAYRVARIVDGAPWDSEVRSPLRLPGVDVKEGDYILAVNGIPLDTARDPWAAFQGLAGKTVVLRVNDKPSAEGARDVLVETMAGEGRLRHLEWIEANRRRVDKASGGRVGYVYMPDTGGGGQTELIRQYYSQIDKDGFVIDERFNSGGQLADRFVELLGRPIVHYLAWRYGAPVQQPRMANPGPKVMLINGWSVSGGDAFPYTFKDQKIGPIVGTRTAGGLIGPAVGHRTIDGGFYTVPEGRIYGNDGRWFPEGIGVAPDIEVVDDPSQLARGTDPQLERAVTEVMRLLEQNPPREVPPPPFEDRTAAGSK
ncbi:MAG: PDZ domain-containing protein, partial [Acidobacteria bacterium]|nr:PDZ domain-containing protein [Acidobacteriota bacterium]